MQHFDDEFFENAAEKTSMYHMSRTGKVLKVTSHKIKQLFGMHIIMGCLRFPHIHMYWRRGLQLELVSSVMVSWHVKSSRC